MNLVVALDSSASAGETGCKKQAEYAVSVAGRLSLGPGPSRFGALFFGDTATPVQEPGSDLAAIAQKLRALSPKRSAKQKTNTGEAMALALQMLERAGRPGLPSVV